MCKLSELEEGKTTLAFDWVDRVTRKAGRLMAVLAVGMFVATGASHDLLHLDEPAHAAQAHADPGHADHAGIERAAHPDVGADAVGCSAHSASAHAAAPVPSACIDAPNAALAVAWRPAVAAIVHDLSPDIPHGPPRA